MAWHDIAYACGHTGREQIYGPTKQRDRVAWGRGQRVCPDCYQAQLQAAREQENAAAVQWARDIELPALQGTPKQVAYGETCRRKWLEGAETWPEERWALMQPVLAQMGAHWWIEQTPATWERVLRALTAPPAEEPAVPPWDRVALDEEVTACPASCVTDIPATIACAPDAVTIRFPERRHDFRTMVKELGFRWQDGQWVRAMNEFTGAPADRAAEVGHRMLALGIPVRIPDLAVRIAALTGTYAFEQERWIMATPLDEYQDWFTIRWGRADDLYHASRRLAGSRYVMGRVVVPSENFAEVLDFAARYGFTFSVKAQTLVARAQERKAAMLIVAVPRPATKAPVIGASTPPVLPVPEEVAIDAAFRDDD